MKHGNVVNSEDQMMKSVAWDIRSRVMGDGEFKDSLLNKSICSRSGFHDCILCLVLFAHKYSLFRMYRYIQSLELFLY